MSIIQGTSVTGSTGAYQISRSLRFNSADTAYLNRTPASAGNRKTWTWSGWVKRTNPGTLETLFSGGTVSGDTTHTNMAFSGTDFLAISSDLTSWRVTTQVFRDPSAWYHIVYAVDTTQATANNRIKMYVNGSEITAFGTINNPSQNSDLGINSATAHNIGRRSFNSDRYMNGYLTEINFIDGSALDPTSFGEFNSDTGVWQPKAYTGSYGTNGFYLNFSDNSGVTSTTLGADSSGNGNNWTPNNFSVTAGAGNDSLVDTPTNYGTDTGVGGEVRGNYCTLNPLNGNASSVTNGNLTFVGDTGFTYYLGSIGTFGVSSGKWYWEAYAEDGDWLTIGIIPANAGPITSTVNINYLLNARTYMINGNKTVGTGSSSQTSTAYGATYTTGDLIGVALDMDVGTLTFYKNGVSQGTAFTGLSGTQMPLGSGFNSGSATFNFGQRPWAYTPPSGFKALCTQNLPEPTIVDGGEYFNTVLYTGNGSTNAITGVGFAPDFVWAKGRSVAYSHGLYDAVRGVTKKLSSNLTNAEVTGTGLTAFGSDGFTMDSDAGLNQSSATYVAWNWKANGAGVSNTDGTITSTVSANTDSGFSIVTWTATNTAATIGHGLGVAPAMIMVKSRADAANWTVYHQAIGNTGGLVLNGTNAVGTNINWWNNTSPTSSVFSVGSFSNYLTGGHVAYCFAPVAGYSAFGSYTGNGSTDGPFVYTGFRPRWILIKLSSAAGGAWYVYDTSRNTSNVMNLYLRPDASDAENTFVTLDALSNGFKLITSNTQFNGSGSTYIYAAFAENPFKYSLAR